MHSKCLKLYTYFQHIFTKRNTFFRYIKDLALKTDNQQESVVRVALFGVGRAGTIHLTNILSNTRSEILYIVDDVESNWPNMRQRWRLDNVTFLTSKQSAKVFKDPKVDAVVVASPTYTHEEIVIKALEAKKAVFCEKPIAENISDTVKCYEIAKKSGQPLFCAFNRRFDPSYSNVRDRVRNGEVGHIHTIKTVSRDSPLPTVDYLKMSGGIFHDCIVHDIDMVTWVLGEYPDKVSVLADANVPEIKAIDDFDTIGIVMHFPSGTIGMIDISRNSTYGYDQRLEVFGPKGMVKAENEQPTFVHQYDLHGVSTAPIWYSFASRFMNGYRREFDHFLDIIHGKAESSVKAKEILAVSKIATACEESARTGKVVNLKWVANELPENN
ncbi:hypothetical protein PUN28_012177 [Cardiocondyla obscurior]|uniref:Myo-inositol 2-dehydrogenase n=1 Tax=Cardiocondyla obscurior TaxID=286306 RepID=A0AAW2FE73_9HYME